jgi:hypothetical protein
MIFSATRARERPTTRGDGDGERLRAGRSGMKRLVEATMSMLWPTAALFAASSQAFAQPVEIAPAEVTEPEGGEIVVVPVVDVPQVAVDVVPPSPVTVEVVPVEPAETKPGAVLFMAGPDRREELREALVVELAGRGLEVVPTDPPPGSTPDERMAAAHQAAMVAGASAAVWVEEVREGTTGETVVQAVGAGGTEVRFAPLPGSYDEIARRVFALVAASLVDEVLAPPGVPVTVHIDVDVGAPPPALVEIPAPVAPPVVVPLPPVDWTSFDVESLIGSLQLQRVAAGADFVPWLGTSWIYEGRDVRMFSFNLVGGLAGGLDGFELAGAFDLEVAFVRGLQIAGALNYDSGWLLGMQIAGGANIVWGPAGGVQIAGGVNIAGLLAGMQVANVNLSLAEALGVQIGGVNYAGRAGDEGVQRGVDPARSLVGAQIGAADVATGYVEGVQIGMANVAGGYVAGTQIGMANVAAGYVEGAQIGMANVSGEYVNGAQIGMVNVAAGDVAGAQIGMVNVAADADFGLAALSIYWDGRTNLDVWGTDTGYVNVALKHGSRYFHNIYLVGTNVTNGNVSFGFGYGGHAPLSDMFFLDVDGIVQYDQDTSDWHWQGLRVLSQLRVVLGIRVLPWLAITGGLSYNVQFSDKPNGPIVPLFGATTFDEEEGFFVQGWPGFQIGLELL